MIPVKPGNEDQVHEMYRKHFGRVPWGILLEAWCIGLYRALCEQAQEPGLVCSFSADPHVSPAHAWAYVVKEYEPGKHITASVLTSSHDIVRGLKPGTVAKRLLGQIAEYEITRSKRIKPLREPLPFASLGSLDQVQEVSDGRE